MFADRLYTGGSVPTDEEDRIRIDDWEMRDDVQAEVLRLFHSVTEETIKDVTDIDAYHNEFLTIHGFGVEGVDYDKEMEP